MSSAASAVSAVNDGATESIVVRIKKKLISKRMMLIQLSVLFLVFACVSWTAERLSTKARVVTFPKPAKRLLVYKKNHGWYYALVYKWHIMGYYAGVETVVPVDPRKPASQTLIVNPGGEIIKFRCMENEQNYVEVID